MRKNLVICILRETKEREWRTPLVPFDVKWLTKRGVCVEVESSLKRVFSDEEYKKSGAKIVEKPQKAALLLGIKEPPAELLYKDKIYMFFSHTTKGQPHNMPLLKSCLKNKITLLDYEKIVNRQGDRLVYFGRFAGVCGLVDSLHYLGEKLNWKGIENPFSIIEPAYNYNSFKDVKKTMRQVNRNIKRYGFAEKLTPFIIGITGHGNVSKGVQEILALLDPIEIHPKEILRFVQHKIGKSHKLYKIIFLREEKLRCEDGKPFYFEEYLADPDKFESNLDVFLPYLNILIHTSYWDARYPRLVTKKMIHRLSRRRPFRLEFIADISCDIHGAIELTYKSGSSIGSTFTYDARNKGFIQGHRAKGITILAVDNLPSELPKDASVEFSSFIRDYVYQIAAHGIKDITNHVALPGEIRRAVITQGGRFTKDFQHLKKHIKAVK